MSEIKPGSRMRSAVCATEVMVIAMPADAAELRCGGAAMVPVDQDPPGGSVAPDANKGTLIGKRYVNSAANAELLCTKPGEGSLALGDELLVVKEAKPLPSSD